MNIRTMIIAAGSAALLVKGVMDIRNTLKETRRLNNQTRIDNIEVELKRIHLAHLRVQERIAKREITNIDQLANAIRFEEIIAHNEE